MSVAASKMRQWREDPRVFVREVFGITPDPWQDEVLAAFPKEQRIALKACKGPGKSCVKSWCAWNFLATRPHPKVVATSITGDNLRDGLWAEMAKWQGKSEFLKAAFQWTGTRIFAKDHPETWFASARQWSKSADPTQQADTLAGIHAEFVLFLIDEAGGVPDAVASAAEAALATGTETKLFISGNPTMLSGPLYRACTRERGIWWVREITGAPDDPMRAPRIDPKWAQEQIDKYGKDSPWVLVNVFGKFPPAQSNALLGVEEIGEATRRTIEPAAYECAPRILGVDVARFGDDRSVIFPRQGRNAMRPRVFRNVDLMQLASHVGEYIGKWRPHAVFVDETGVGGGVVDRLRQLGRDVVGVQFGGKALQTRYANKRTEMWCEMAEWVKSGGALPDMAELVSDLTGPTYSFNSNGSVFLEPKQHTKERGLPSPDLADALALTFAAPVAIPEVWLPGADRPQSLHCATDYNPFEARA